MGKKISAKMVLWFVCLMLLSLATTRGFARISSLGGVHTEFGTENDPQFGKPFQIYAHGSVRGQAKAELHVTLSEGIQLIKGNLFSYGHFENGTTKCDEELTVLINKPGTYEASFFFNATEVPDLVDAKFLPQNRSFYIYAREDTIAKFNNKAVMERCIRDSLIIPQEEIYRRDDAKVKAKYFAEHPDKEKEMLYLLSTEQPAKLPLEYKNGHPVIVGILPGDLMYGSPPRWFPSWAHFVHGYPVTSNYYPFSVLSDSLYHTDLSDRFTLKQIRFISTNRLLISPPRPDCEQLLLADTTIHPSYRKLPMEKQIRLAQLGKRQLMELYEFDRQYFYTEPTNVREFVRERYKIIDRQLQEVSEAKKQ